MELYQKPLIGQKGWQQHDFRNRVAGAINFIGHMKEGFLCGAVWTETKLKARDKGVH